MSVESRSATPEYRLGGLSLVEARLLPLTRLLVALPWAAATLVILRSLAVWVGLWAAIAVGVIRCAAWLFMRLLSWALPDDEYRRRSTARHPDEAVYPRKYEEPLAALIAARHDVLAAAGMPESRLRLMVRDKSQTRGMPAYAQSHRLVVASISAVRELPPVQLRALVAHELGHHVIGGWLLRTIEILCTTPALTFFGGPTKLLIETLPRRDRWTMYHALVLLIAYPIPFATLVALMLPAVDVRVAVALAALCELQLFPMMWLSWRKEYLCDRVAVDLGYGPAFRDFLLSHARTHDPHFTLTHPSVAARIARINLRMRRGNLRGEAVAAPLEAPADPC
ncbi:M48 family metalloprotease [Nocardia sp. NPDC051981]|uniref:M48 family metalloprotease n=1 Tax=Nocardia sp. NPDC051981 TaxID=3155417 RepID=UPI003431C39C